MARAPIRPFRSRAGSPVRRPRSTALCCCGIGASDQDASPRSPSSRWTATSWSGSKRRGLADRLAFIVASVAGAGYSPAVPGTVGSFITLIALWLIPFSRPALLWTLVVVTILGLWAGSRAGRAPGIQEPGLSAVDRVAGRV